MYAAIKDGNILGIHEDIEVVKEFSRKIPNSKVVKLKKKKRKELHDSYIEDDLYLIRYGNSYFPYELYSVAEKSDLQKDYDLRYCRDALVRFIMDEEFSKKDIKRMIKVVEALANKIGRKTDHDYEFLKEMAQWEKQVKESIDSDNS